MTGCTTIHIVVSEDKKVNMKMDGKAMHPIEVCKVLHMMTGQLMNAFQAPEETKIITPDKKIITA
jgi:hypothetical protein